MSVRITATTKTKPKASGKWKSHLLFLNKKWHECEITSAEKETRVKFHSV
jgi:hypothetical protein